MSDWYEDYKREKIKTILRDGKTYDERKLHCPYCGFAQDNDLWEYFDLSPCGEEKEGQCYKCERHFSYKVNLAFSTRKLK